MASTVNVPLLGPHKKGTVVGVTIGGFAVAGYMIYRRQKKAKADETAATASTDGSAAYGYGDGSAASGDGAYPPGYYGYGQGVGGPFNDGLGGGFGGSGGQGGGVDNDGDGMGGNVSVPDVIGEHYNIGAAKIHSAGLVPRRAEANVGTVTSQIPAAGSRTPIGSTVVLSGKGKKKTR